VPGLDSERLGEVCGESGRDRELLGRCRVTRVGGGGEPVRSGDIPAADEANGDVMRLI
jgi:hypothetical protein